MDINNIVNSTRMRNARLFDDINNKILNREYYKFKYLPLEGALPGLYFQQQTEDAINDIGNVAYATEQVADEALQVAQQAYNIALAALETANNALAAAQTAQQTANTALNIANNALSVGTAAATAAAAAQNRADEAYDLADAAQKAADAAQNTADAAQEAANNAGNDATNALTKAEDALTKMEQLSVLNYYNNLTEETDVNTLVDVHRWYLQASNNPNAPETNPGFLNVDNDYNDSVCKQLWVSETTGAIYNRFGQIVENSDPATVSSWSEWYKLATKADIDGTTTDLTEKITTVANNLATHEADFSNPHKVTAEQLGLTTVYQYKGSVATYADLPTTGQKVGDVWNVETADPDHGIKAGDNVAWDGAQWDILGGNHDLSGYAQLAGTNQFTGSNTFKNDVQLIGNSTVITNLIAASAIETGSPGNIQLGSNTGVGITGTGIGALNYNVLNGSTHNFYINTESVFSIGGTQAASTLTLGGKSLAESNDTGISLKNILAPTADTDAANKKYVDDAVAACGDVTAAGDNNFTGTNTFNKAITVRDGALAGIGGTITLGTKPNSATTQAKINSAATGAMYYTATEGQAHFFNVGATEVATVGGTETTATLDFLANHILNFNNTNGLQVGAGTTGNIYFNPTTADAKGTLQIRGVGAMDFNGNELHLNKNGDFNGSSNTTAIKFNNNTILAYSNAFKNLSIKAMGDDNILELGVAQGAWNVQLPNNNGDVRIANRLYLGNKNGVGAGVISAENTENCLYFMGTAENTYFATPNTGNTISYQSAANCYLINCAINNPSSLNMNFSKMNFKATVGSVPYMCKTLTFWLPVSATVPAVTWTFPTDSAVYYPKGVAPTLTANANNIINVIAIVDDTDSFSIQVCDTVVLPYSG